MSMTWRKNDAGGTVYEVGETNSTSGNEEIGPLPVTSSGAAASGAAASGNPTLVGGRYDSTVPPSVDDGDVVEVFTDDVGRVWVKAGGAANLASSQVTTSTTAGTLAIARPTRRRLTAKNTDSSITVYVGPATVTAANGMPLLAGESMEITWVGLVQVISASGTPIVAIHDEYG